MANTKVRGITIELSADATGVNSALKDINSALKSTQSDLRDIEKLLKLDPTNTELLAQKQNALQKALEQTGDKLKTLKEAEADLAKQMENGGTEEQEKQLNALRREIVSTETDMKKYQSQLDDTEQSTTDVTTATKKAGDSASDFGNKLATAGKVAAAAFAAVTAAAVAVTKEIADMISETAEYSDNIDKMSQKMGMSAEAYQEWDFVLQHCGSSMDVMKTSMKTLATAAETGKDAFDKLGISQEEIANLSQEDLFARTIEGLQNVEDTTERTYLAGQLLGRGATELGALLNMTADETANLRDRLGEIGGLMSDDAVKAAATFQDSLQDLQTAFSGFKRNLVSDFMPGVSKAMDGLTEIFSGDAEEGLAVIDEATDEIIQVMNDKLPTFIEAGGKILISILKGIVTNLPQLVPAIVDVVLEIVDTLIDNLPTIIDAAIQIIFAIAQGIIKALPDLIPSIVEVVLQIVETLLENIDLLIECAIDLIIGLAEGIVNAIPIIIEKAPQIISGLVTGLASGIGQLFEAGWNLIKGLWEGIKEGAVWLWQKITGWLSDLWTGIKDFFGIHSPSTKMKWVGDMIGEGFAKGIEESAQLAIDAAESMATDVLGTIGGVNTNLEVGLNGGSVGTGTTFVQNNYSPKALSRLDIYRYGNNLAALMEAQ